MAEPVAERAARTRCPRSTSRAAASASMPARRRGSRRAPPAAPRARPRTPRASRRQLAGRERPRAVRDVAADVGAGVDDDQLARLDRRVAGTPVRPAPVGPEPTIASNAGSSAPSSWKSRVMSQATSRSRAADERLLAHEPLEHPVGDRARAPDRLELALVLDRPQLLDEPLPRHELEPGRRASLGERPRQRRPPRSRSGRRASRRASRCSSRFV